MNSHGTPLFKKPTHAETRWASFENPSAARGAGGKLNRSAKGRPFEELGAGETKTLLAVNGSGLVTRIWLTISNRSPKMLRSLRLDMYWDDAPRPAVSVPLGDFFGIGLGRRTRFECALFSDPEGRSFNCAIPMPFRKSARITISNDSDENLSHLFYDVDLLLGVEHDAESLYFHGHFRREAPNELGKNFVILPTVRGGGRYLGCNLGVITDPRYAGTWFGEGEFKAWIDGDRELPTLCGTGTEDLIGTAWGQGVYAHATQGCLIGDENNGQYAFYRYHVHDPIYFSEDFRAELQTIGGAGYERVLNLESQGIPVRPVTVEDKDRNMMLLLDQHPGGVRLADVEGATGWCNFFRQDDWSATAYFYLDRPDNDLPALPDAALRTRALLQTDDATARADT